MSNEQEIQSGFIRQRRNLMVMSIVVLLSEITELKISKVAVFGNEAVINNPDLVLKVMWLFLAYWLVRYYQYFHEIGDKGFVRSFKSKRKKLLEKMGFRRLFNDPIFIEWIPNGSDGKKLKSFPESFEVYEDRLFHVESEAEFLLSDHRHNGGTLHKEHITFSPRQLLIPSIVAVLDVLIRTRYFSEYLLPFVLFVLPLVFSNANAHSWLLSILQT